MVKFAHLADTHLGYRQYGLVEREEDFYNTFLKVIEDIISESPDFVIHSGDLFETNRPSTQALFTFQNALNMLNKENIPIYATSGNHDISLKKGFMPPQVLYKLQGLNLITPNNPYYVFDEEVFIGGVEYKALSYKNLLKDSLAELSKLSEDYNTKILVLHQGIDKFMPFGSELEIGEIPEGFNYYALGHLHNYINVEYGGGRLVYPGSSEVWKSSELGDYKKNGKGYVLSSIKNGEVKTKRKSVNISREFISQTIEYKNLFNALQDIKNKIIKYNKPPIINLNVTGEKFNTGDVYETVHQYLDDYALLVRPSCELNSEKEILDKGTNESLDPKKFIHSYFKDSKYKNAGDFTLDLYNKLSHGELEEAKSLADSYYSEDFREE